MSERKAKSSLEASKTSTSKRDTDRLPARDGADQARVGSEPRRVAVFAPRLVLDGISLYAKTLLRALRSDSHETLLVSPAGPLAETLRSSGQQWIELPDNGRPGFFQWRKLREALEEFHPDVLHAVAPNRELPAVRAADALKRPLVVSVHGIKPDELPQSNDRSYDAYIAADQSVRERLLNDARLERDRTTMIMDSAFPGVPPEQPDSKRRPVVGWVSPLMPGCGYACFIEAAIKVQARGVDAMYSILGSGPMGEEVRDRVESRGMLQRVVVVQELYDYGSIWSPFEIAVVDTRQPASAVMVLHAMANGRPVIATEGGAVFDLIRDGVDGLIVPRDDPDALAERILMLVQNPTERYRMAKEAYDKVEEQYPPAEMAHALGAVYSALLNDEPMPKVFETRGKRSARTVVG